MAEPELPPDTTEPVTTTFHCSPESAKFALLCDSLLSTVVWPPAHAMQYVLVSHVWDWLQLAVMDAVVSNVAEAHHAVSLATTV